MKNIPVKTHKHTHGSMKRESRLRSMNMIDLIDAQHELWTRSAESTRQRAALSAAIRRHKQTKTTRRLKAG